MDGPCLCTHISVVVFLCQISKLMLDEFGSYWRVLQLNSVPQPAENFLAQTYSVVPGNVIQIRPTSLLKLWHRKASTDLSVHRQRLSISQQCSSYRLEFVGADAVTLDMTGLAHRPEICDLSPRPTTLKEFSKAFETVKSGK